MITHKENSNILPELKDWKELYEVAVSFYQETPWEWMWDSDNFGVANPVYGEDGYCCILGRGGQLYGIAVYMGADGLEGYLKERNGAISADDPDALYSKKCLLLTFEGKKDLAAPDLGVIKSLGLSFKGKNAWPLFRSYRPGYFPWYLTKDEVDFLVFCLQQANGVALRFKDNPRLFDAPDRESFFVRVFQNISTGLNWNDSWVKPVPLKKVLMMVKDIDIARIGSIKSTAQRRGQAWEADCFYSPVYVAEKGKRPYYPLTFLLVDSQSFFILHVNLTTPDKYRMELDEQLLAAIEKIKIIPQEIRVKNEELFVLLGRVSEELGIKLRVVKNLRAVADVRKHMSEHFRKGS